MYFRIFLLRQIVKFRYKSCGFYDTCLPDFSIFQSYIRKVETLCFDKTILNAELFLVQLKTDQYVTADVFCELDRTMINSINDSDCFWPGLIKKIILNESDNQTNDWFQLSQSISDYFLAHKQTHAHLTLVWALKLLAHQKRYLDMLDLFAFMLKRLDQLSELDNKEFLMSLMLEPICFSPYWRDVLKFDFLLQKNYLTNEKLSYNRILLAVVTFNPISDLMEVLDKYGDFLTVFYLSFFKRLLSKFDDVVSLNETQVVCLFDQIFHYCQLSQDILEQRSVEVIKDIFDK